MVTPPTQAGAIGAGALHREVQERFNAGDLDGLVALYESNAVMGTPEGGSVTGHDAIRETWGGMLALGGTMSLVTRFVLEQGDLALLRNDWRFTAEGIELSSQSAEVARRQTDGSWRYLFDHPFGASPDLPSP